MKPPKISVIEGLIKGYNNADFIVYYLQYEDGSYSIDCWRDGRSLKETLIYQAKNCK